MTATLVINVVVPFVHLFREHRCALRIQQWRDVGVAIAIAIFIAMGRIASHFHPQKKGAILTVVMKEKSQDVVIFVSV